MIARIDHDAETGCRARHDIRYHLRERIAEEDGDKRIKQIEQPQQSLRFVGRFQNIVWSAAALVQKQDAAEEKQGQGKIGLNGLRPVPGEKDEADK